MLYEPIPKESALAAYVKGTAFILSKTIKYSSNKIWFFFYKMFLSDKF